MSADEPQAIQVNFGKPMPLFPLDTVTLLPHQILPLHIFEPRYRQMVDHALDGAGQIAMAVFEGARWKKEYHGRPPLRAAVCVGHIVQHEKLQDGRYNLLLQGVCRARILRESPSSEKRLYREALLEPLGVEPIDDALLSDVRSRLEEVLSDGPLTMWNQSETILEHIRNEDVPTQALLELVSFALVQPQGLRYKLLSEGDVQVRAQLVLGELDHLTELLRRAVAQKQSGLPKGCNWN